MPITLELRAKAEVWVQVSLDGKEVLDATLQPGASHIFQGRSVVGLRVGNAAGLQVFWNGTDIGTMGGEGQVRRLYFTPEKVGADCPVQAALAKLSDEDLAILNMWLEERLAHSKGDEK